MTTCSFPGCTRPVYSRRRGLCKRHSQQMSAGGELHPIRARGQRTACSFPGCERTAANREPALCASHRRQHRDAGEVGPIRSPRDASVPLHEWVLRGCERTSTGCLVYTRRRDKDGYGIVYSAPANRRTHRVVYEALVEPIPAGRVVMHSCDNPPCCNVDHLSVGTHRDNARDAADKGRNPGHVRHSVELLAEAARLVLEEGVSQGEAARRTGLTQSYVSKIVRGKAGRVTSNAEAWD